jgi:carbonic anhydrase/acetyltransferase-like protein (isoleucine patch superfamily)
LIGKGATVGANAVVPNRMHVPPGALAVGVPASLRPGQSNQNVIRVAAAEYVSNGHRFRTKLTRID